MMTLATGRISPTSAASARGLAAGLLIALAVMAGSPSPARAEGALATRRLAVVVGANAAAPGRKPLHFAQRDAVAVAQVLRDLGGFAAADVHLLLDPRPAEVVQALDAALREAGRSRVETLVLFYYSGHADTTSLFPSGQALPLAELRRRLDDGRAAMRIGIIDACRGGGWTGSKGLSASQTFEIEQALDLATEGSVLIASSSGLEDAHESLALRGSFFTHHWNAALRGAADRNGDDHVTLGEAFEYARALTIRDTALENEVPQHPSFRFNLKGRGDLSLAELSPGSSVIELVQTRGPLQVVHLGTGLLIVELPAGQRRVRVSLWPGHYLVRRRAGDDVLAREVLLEAGRRLSVLESSLTPVPIGRFAAKGVGEVEEVPDADQPPRRSPPSEFLLSFSWMKPRYDIFDFSEFGGRYTTNAPTWSIQGGYLLRHGRYLATRLGAGFAHPDKIGNGSLLAIVGEALSWPLLEKRDRLLGTGTQVVEPYLAANLVARAEISRGDQEVPYQVQTVIAGGMRLFLFYAQVGYAVNLLPKDVTTTSGADSSVIQSPGPTPALEVGFRLAKNF